MKMISMWIDEKKLEAYRKKHHNVSRFIRNSCEAAERASRIVMRLEAILPELKSTLEEMKAYFDAEGKR